MQHQPRFLTPSSSLRLGSLVVGTRRGLLVGLAAALALHAGFSQLRGWVQEAAAAKPLTTQFVKRQPRLTKPLELKKRPRPKRRSIQRRMVAVEARLSGRQSAQGFPLTQVVRGLARPGMHLGRAAGFAAAVVEPTALAQHIAGSREDKDVVDMSLEMMDVQALDTGKYHAMVIQDPTDRRGVKGFFHLLLARPHSLSRMKGRGDDTSVWDDMSIGVRLMVEAMNRWTDIRIRIAGQITFDDSELFKVPWVITPVSNTMVSLTLSEAENMGRYLSQGGFQFLDNAWGVPGLLFEYTTRKVGQDIMASIGFSEGNDWRFERLPKNHPIYHCFFDFDTPPQAKDSDCYYVGKQRGIPRAPMHDYLEGVTIDGRLWILLSNKGYSIAWHDWSPGAGPYEKDASRIWQFGINTIVFALTQEGSITKQVMDTVRF